MNKKFKELYMQDINNNEGFIFNNNYKLIKINSNYCKLEGLITKNSLNPFGIVHGGYIFGLADTTAGILANSQGKNAVTTSSTINYLYKAIGKKLISEATILKKGKNIITCEVQIYNEKERMVAKAILEYFVIDKENL